MKTADICKNIDWYQKLERCYACIQDRIPFQPEVALVLGSGLGGFADSGEMQIEAVIPYEDIEDFPISTVSGHAGRFVFGRVGNTKVVCMQGRIHYYEGYDIHDVVLPVRLMHRMGADRLFLTNAAGGVNYSFRAGDFMLIQDHISNFVPSPLIGANQELLGPRFPDMSNVYTKELQDIITAAAADLNIGLKQGIYVQLTGPNYETPAEVRMVRLLGGDAVGMSTACEAMAAAHMGMQVCGISLISNMACGMTENRLSHEEVKEAADAAAADFVKLVTLTLQRFHRE